MDSAMLFPTVSQKVGKNWAQFLEKRPKKKYEIHFLGGEMAKVASD